MVKLNHLSDFQIQELLSGENRLRKSFYNDHLLSCTRCQAKLSEYEKLFSKIENADDIKISPDFTKNVLLKAKELESKESRIQILVFLLPFVIGLSALAMLEYLGAISLLTVSQNSGLFVINFFSTVSTNLFSWLPSLNVSFELVAIGTLSATLFHLLDLLLVKPRFR